MADPEDGPQDGPEAGPEVGPESEEPLFDPGQLHNAACFYEVDDVVAVQTIWGYETCRVVEKGRDPYGYPVVTLAGESGDRFTISSSRIAGRLG